jgi:gluconolactonase
MAASRISRISPDGTRKTITTLDGTPNGAAIGPDGALYVCNRGETMWHEMGPLLIPDHNALELRGGGSIQRLDLASGEVSTLYTACDGIELNGPNDIVFDALGGFWFTDFGHMRKRDKDYGGVFYARADGSSIRQVIWPMDSPNGIALSPDNRSLLVVETFNRYLWRFDISGPGEIAPNPQSFLPHGGHFVGGPGGFGTLDSFAVDSLGNALVAAPLAAALYVISPDGAIETVPMPDMAPTNVCFGGHDLRTAFVTLATSQRILAMPWRCPGLALNH